MPNLEVRCSKDMERFFLENDGQLLKSLHALLQNHQSLDPLTENLFQTLAEHKMIISQNDPKSAHSAFPPSGGTVKVILVPSVSWLIR